MLLAQNISKLSRCIYWLPAFSMTTQAISQKPQSKQSTTDSREKTFLESTYDKFDEAAKYTNISQDMLNYYKTFDCKISFNLPLERKDGSVEQIHAFRVQHKLFTLPTKGGVRLTDQFSMQDCEAMALFNTLQSALFGIPFGGAKGCIAINPQKYNPLEIENLTRRYTIELAKRNMIGASIDIQGPALGTSKREMNWIKDTFQNFFGQYDIHSHACCVGKGYNQGGVRGLEQSNGFGIWFSLKTLFENQEYAKMLGLEGNIQGKTFIVQGFGKVGYYASKYLHENGAILIGVAERDGSVYNPKGINPDEFLKHFMKNNSIKNFQGASETLEKEQVIYKKCDILLPCYAENQIHKGNYQKINCKYIVEGATGPLTSYADKQLQEKGVIILPGLLVNTGSCCATYFEWVKNLSHKTHGQLTKRWEQKSKLLVLKVIEKVTGLKTGQLDNDEMKELEGASEVDLVLSGLEELFGQAIQEVMATMKQNKQLSLRTASYLCAINKLNEAYMDTGISFRK